VREAGKEGLLAALLVVAALPLVLLVEVVGLSSVTGARGVVLPAYDREALERWVRTEEGQEGGGVDVLWVVGRGERESPRAEARPGGEG
jgi:hypothetical protein